MRDIANVALNKAQVLGAEYADIRIITTKLESISVRNGKVESISSEVSAGFGVRVIADKSWGFAASNLVDKEEIANVTKSAVGIAKSSATVGQHHVKLSPVDKIIDSYETEVEIDPFNVPKSEKIDLLLKADEIMRCHKKIAISSGFMRFYQKDQLFASTEGSFINQKITESGAGIASVAVDGGEIEQRSYPNSMGGQTSACGYELVNRLDLPGHADKTAEQAVALLSAKECPSTTTTVILDGSQLALQIHESIGHPTELDRILGTEASFAGTSFVTLDKLRRFRYGSSIISVTADATIKGALGSFGYDDEGVPAQKVYIIKDGILTGLLTSRETAAYLGTRSNGTMRADGWKHFPLIRMTNINILPGNWDLDDLIADTKEGLFLETNKSWSIDDKRLNFQFATEIGWQIKNGKITSMVKKPNYTGITPQFWRSCDAICNRKHWQVWGTPNCGKGEPMQVAHVAHGAAPARFRNVQVGVGK
jgi:TldD protein